MASVLESPERPAGVGAEAPPSKGRWSWTNIIVLGSSHVLAVVAVVYLGTVQFSWWTVALGLLWFALCGVSVTAGYHRLFSHRAYEAAAWLRGLFLVFGAASVQNSVVKWSADHRRHHTDTDGPTDPYTIRQGFWWAHLGWVLRRDSAAVDADKVRDLEADPLIRLQARWYVPLAVGVGFLAPFGLGFLWGDPLGSLLVAGFLRLVVQWHATFAVNSLAHCVGRQPYSTLTTARDSFWVAIITLGEGYHNFHHRFQADYRNGIRWYHFDPTKWIVRALSWVGATGALKQVPAPAIAKARAAAQAERTARSG